MMGKTKLLVRLLIPVALLAALLGGCDLIEERFPGLTGQPQSSTPAATTTAPPANTGWNPPGQTSGPELENWVEAVEKARPSVVAVETSTGAGSGWIVDSAGIIVTNQHVIEGAAEVGVVLSDGRFLEAVDVYSDPVTDIAVIMVDADGLPAAVAGSSATLKVGQPVAAVGNALGLGISMKGGWVSRLNISTVIDGRALYGLIETDAAMNPGNSGGPLINLAGEVVGITNAKLVDITIESVGYAISIDSALPVIERLVREGFIPYPLLGVSGMVTVDPAVASFFDLGVTEGVFIHNVTPDTGAFAAGMLSGDVILSVDGEAALTVEDLVSIIRSKAIGQTVQVEIDRGGQRLTLSVTLGSMN